MAVVSFAEAFSPLSGATMRKSLAVFLLAASLAATVAVAAPVQNVDPARHPHLAEAQRLSFVAWQKIDDAQVANKGKLGGHAARAKQLLEEANVELRLAAAASDQNHK
jgi:hypothetical protein